MESWKKEIISKNLPSLLEDTSCGESFMAYLTFLSKEEKSTLNTLLSSKSSQAANATLYNIAQTRSDGFEVLKSALQGTRQSGPLKTLVDAEKSYKASNPPNPSGVAPTNNPVTPPTNHVVGSEQAEGNNPIAGAVSEGWKQVRVGVDPNLTEIGDCLSKSPSTSILWKKLPDVARALKFPKSDMIVKNVEIFETKSYPQYLNEILTNWNSIEPENATLENLIKVLKKHDLNDSAGTLSTTFQNKPFP